MEESAQALEPRSGLSHGAIRGQLNRILSSREFQATERMRDFLTFVVEEALAGRADRLKGYTIATKVFSRSSDFDAAQDPIVRIQAGRLRRALERYCLVAGGRDPIRIDIPKGRYVPFFIEQLVEASDTPASISGPDILIAPLPSGPTIAVLPLTNLPGDPDQRFFAIGLAEELVTELGRFQEIVVIPCQQAAQDIGSPGDLRKLGESVGARFLLGGTLRKDAKTAKVSVQLTDARTGRQIWADAYKHELDASSLIATQEEIARSVVAAIGSEYGIMARRLSAESRKKRPADLDTYEAMLRYYHYQIAPSPEASRQCFLALQRAVEREPDYGPAWSALATLHSHMYIFDVPGSDNPLEVAMRYARRGVALEPGSQLGRLILAYACFLGDKTECFRQEADTALALNPNSPDAMGSIGYMYTMGGEFERGRPLLDTAIRVNPCHPQWFHHANHVYHYHRREYDDAFQELQKSTALDNFWVRMMGAAVSGQLGRRSDAAAQIEELVKLKPDFPSRARELLRRTLKIDSLIEELVDGLRKAGLEVSEG